MQSWDIGGKTVKIDDWDSALIAASSLDKLEPGEDRSLIQGKAALRVVAEYGLRFYETAHPGKGIQLNLAIVIDKNVVYITLSKDGADGVFIGEYSVEKYGEWVKKLTVQDVWGFSNIEAMLEGWTFFAEMLNHSRRNRLACPGQQGMSQPQVNPSRKPAPKTVAPAPAMAAVVPEPDHNDISF